MVVSSANNMQCQLSRALGKIIRIDDEQEWAKYTALWHTAGDITNIRICVTICDELPPIGEVAPEPLQGHITNVIVLKCTQKNSVVYCRVGAEYMGMYLSTSTST